MSSPVPRREGGYELLETIDAEKEYRDDDVDHYQPPKESLEAVDVILKEKDDTWSPVDSMSHSFVPSIEGLRGIAVSLAMYCHIAGHEMFAFREAAGTMGVTIFFVLSGFLITAVLMRLEAKKKFTYSYVPRFYADRFFRLGPAMILMVIIASFFHWYLSHDMKRVGWYALLVLTYTTNITTFWIGGTGPFGNTWSLACEEQFYIMWSLLLPLVLARATRSRIIICAFLVGTLFTMEALVGMYDIGGMHWRFGLWSNVWKMLLGASLRLVPLPPWIKKRYTSYIGLLGIAFTLFLTTRHQPSFAFIAPGWKEDLRPFILWVDFFSAISTALILCSVSSPGGGNALLELGLLRFLGRISYSWYLWQVPIIDAHGWQRNWPAIGDTAVALCMALFSTVYIEEPITKAWKQWKEKRSIPKIQLQISQA